ncbi:hypothetical protein FisN_14Lu103 [Fistulifera solaris]|uniref:Uncharacterized protein n=1 Tax=Fistulifera solaris TaxID=1519565 RepID=A0A1Z5J9V6_FISSO|nr:hypothetical protein FisN_14Lu103 [Fistulifera solaris]|eukprot:GAX10598.1 hypothetical protein FisN_14Lu103 [Fistulifera solaris]
MVAVAVKHMLIFLSRETKAYKFDAKNVVRVMQNMLFILELAEVNGAVRKEELFTENFKNACRAWLEKEEKDSARFRLRDDLTISLHGFWLLRTALELMRKEIALKSAEDIYKDLLTLQGEATKSTELDFCEVVEFAGIDERNPKNSYKATELIKTFRPSRNGRISKEIFVWLIKRVYEEYQLLQSATISASRNDHAFEQMMNIICVAIVAPLIFILLGVVPTFLSLFFVGVAVVAAFGHGNKRGFSYEIGDWLEINPLQTSHSLRSFTKGNTDGVLRRFICSLWILSTF